MKTSVFWLLGEKMKAALVLVFLAIAMTGSQANAETENCVCSFERGKSDAQEMHKSWPWFLVGMGCSCLSVVTLAVAGYPSSGNEPWKKAMPWIAFSSVLAIPYIPATFMPLKKAKIPKASDELDLECYRTGYIRRAGMKNTTSLLLGESAAFLGVFLLLRVVISGSV